MPTPPAAMIITTANHPNPTESSRKPRTRVNPAPGEKTIDSVMRAATMIKSRPVPSRRWPSVSWIWGSRACGNGDRGRVRFLAAGR